MQLLESTNFIYGAHSEDEYHNFLRCIQPVVNEKALEPPQLTLFNSLYQVDSYRKRLPTQFAGQLVSTHNACSFKSLDTALLDLEPQQRVHAQQFVVQQKYVVQDFMEITGDYNIAKMEADDVYTLSQLADAKKFLSETTQNLLLKNAIICWDSNMVLPQDPTEYKRLERHFIENYFWKII